MPAANNWRCCILLSWIQTGFDVLFLLRSTCGCNIISPYTVAYHMLILSSRDTTLVWLLSDNSLTFIWTYRFSLIKAFDSGRGWRSSNEDHLCVILFFRFTGQSLALISDFHCCVRGKSLFHLLFLAAVCCKDLKDGYALPLSLCDCFFCITGLCRGRPGQFSCLLPHGERLEATADCQSEVKGRGRERVVERKRRG